MLLTIEYYLVPPEKRKFPRSENLKNPNLYHYVNKYITKESFDKKSFEAKVALIWAKSSQ